jgi:hypothetical protein
VGSFPVQSLSWCVQSMYPVLAEKKIRTCSLIIWSCLTLFSAASDVSVCVSLMFPLCILYS